MKNCVLIALGLMILAAGGPVILAEDAQTTAPEVDAPLFLETQEASAAEAVSSSIQEGDRGIASVDGTDLQDLFAAENGLSCTLFSDQGCCNYQQTLDCADRCCNLIGCPGFSLKCSSSGACRCGCQSCP